MKLFLGLIFFSLSTVLFAQVDEAGAIEYYRTQCLEIARYIGNDYTVDCRSDYHHFNARVSENYSPDKALTHQGVRIAEFNVLHPGMSKTRYKDYQMVAQIINQWDVVAVTELLPLLSDDLRFNQNVSKFLKDAPIQLQILKRSLKNELSKRRLNQDKIRLLKLAIASTSRDLDKAPKLYRKPGYVQILEALHALPQGKEWSLILTPRGEASKDTDVQEMSGFFYRSSVITPKVNSFCRELACLVSMNTDSMKKDYRSVYSRRPFMADFVSGNFHFTLLTSHVVYNSPTDPQEMSTILELAFNTTDLSQLGTGINKENYARFAEVKITLDFMQVLREQYGMKNLMYAGDLNLESLNQFWPEVLKSFSEAKLFIKTPTSVSEGRFYAKGEPTNGLSNDFDHFIFSPHEFQNCLLEDGSLNGGVFNFYQGEIATQINERYLVRNEQTPGQYEKDQSKYDSYLYELLWGELFPVKSEETIGYKEITGEYKSLRIKGIVPDQENIDRYIDGFYERVLDSQFVNMTYYTYFKQIVSDHMPIYMNCSHL